MEKEKEKNAAGNSSVSVDVVREYKVVKSNDLIQNSRFNLSIQEQKIVLYLISKIKPEDVDFIQTEFDIIEFCDICGIDKENGKNYKNLRDAIKSLADKSVWIKLSDGRDTLLRWINKAYIIDKSGKIQIRLDEDMRPYLLQLQQKFTQYELLYTLAMKSRYSIRLYELFKSYQYRRTLEMDIEELKVSLFATVYDRVNDFLRKVIDISLREINEFSDLNVIYEVIKDGRKFAKLCFTITEKNDVVERARTYSKIEGLLG